MQNLLYALIQAIHNVGAVVIVAVGAYGLYFSQIQSRRALALILGISWSIQGLTGGAFGLTTYYYYQQLPDIHGVAIAALGLKVLCVILGFLVSMAYVLWYYKITEKLDRGIWKVMFILGLLALTSAAFLRWFS